MALLDIGVIAVLAVMVIGWFYVDHRERVLARASTIHSQKIRLFQDLDVVIGDLASAISALESARAIDAQKKEELTASYLKLVSIPFLLGSRESVYALQDHLDDQNEPRTDKQTKDYLEGIRNVVLVECVIRTTELQRALLECLSRLEYVEYGANIKTAIGELMGILNELSTQSGAAMLYDDIGLKGLVQPPKLEEWTPRAAAAIKKLKEAMKADLSQSI